MLGLLLVAAVTAWGAAAIGGNDADTSDGGLLRQHGDDRRGDGDGAPLDSWRDGWAARYHRLGPDGTDGAEGIQTAGDAGAEDEPEPDEPEPEPAAAPTLGAGPSPPAQAERPSAGSIEGIVQQVFGPQAGAALGIAWCESKLQPAAVSWSGDYGLFQINAVHAYRWPDFWTAWSDPLRNAQYAYELSAGGTEWGRWACG